MPARTGFLYRRARAIYPGAGSVVARNHGTTLTGDCQLLSPRTQRISREGGTGADDSSGHTTVSPGLAESAACRHHIGHEKTRAKYEKNVSHQLQMRELFAFS